MVRWVAYTAYLVGSAIFLRAAVRRGAVAAGPGSGLFVLGTALHLLEDARQRHPERRSRPTR